MRVAALGFVLFALTGPLLADKPVEPVAIPAVDSVETYAQVKAAVPRHTPDEHHVRCMWRGKIADLDKTMLVVWFTPKADSIRNPAVKTEAAQLLAELRPALDRDRRIEVVVMDAWIPMLGGLLVQGAGIIMRRDPASPTHWLDLDPNKSAPFKRLFEAVLRTFGGIKLN